MVTIDKSNFMEYLRNARELKSQYERANNENPRKAYHFGSVDEIALRLMERDRGVIVTLVSMNQDNVSLHGVEGLLGADGVVYHADTGKTMTFQLKGIDGETIGRFATTATRIVADRALHGSPEVKSIIPQSAARYARRTEHILTRY